MKKPDQKTLNSPDALNSAYTAPEVAHQRKRTIERLNLSGGEKVLDIGCGTGFLTYELAKMVGGNGSVVGIDPDSSMVEHTLSRCAEISHVSALVGEVCDIPVADKTLDIVTCTQVLLYVEEIDHALNEMHRILKTGGRAAILETDWRGVVMSTNYPALSRKIIDAWDATVASPNLPPKLPNLLKQHGFQNIQSEAIPLLNTEYSENSYSVNSIPWLSKNALKREVISEDEKNKWEDDLYQFGEQGAYFFCINRFLFVAEKTRKT